jgi:CDP-diacylglycerol--glycerol-3-phosphate 3-phosphatidyltransferase
MPLNLPNTLTALRILLLPLLGFWIYYNAAVAATVLVAFLGFSDWLDGWYARRYGQETPLGKLLDPIADKLVLCVALVFLLGRPEAPLDSPLLVTLLLAREFWITGLRAIVAAEGLVMPAGTTGKWKTVIQFIGLGCILLAPAWPDAGFFPEFPFRSAGLGLLWASVALSYVSSFGYTWTAYLAMRKKLGF